MYSGHTVFPDILSIAQSLQEKSALHFFFINIHIPLRRKLFQVHFFICFYAIPININFSFFIFSMASSFTKNIYIFIIFLLNRLYEIELNYLV